MEYGMIIISWFVVFLMITGMMVIVVFEKELKNKSEDDNSDKFHMIDLFLHSYYSLDLGGRLEFIILHGARFWSIVLSIIINKVRSEIKKRRL